MLRSGKKAILRSNGGTPTTLSAQSSFVGDFEVKRDIRVDGHFRGRLQAGGRLVIGRQGNIEGETVVHDAVIHGAFSGKMKATGTVQVTASGHFRGELDADKLQIEDGAAFESTCTIGGADGNDAKGRLLPAAPPNL